VVRIFIIVAIVLMILAWLTIYSESQTSYSSREVMVAERIWGQVCGGKTPDVMTQPFTGDTAGRATLGYTEFPGGKRVYTECTIAMDDRNWTVASYCGVFVHEWGHLKRESQEHSSNPNSIMYPVVTHRNRPARCSAEGERLER
jgi:hypothetical protein